MKRLAFLLLTGCLEGSGELFDEGALCVVQGTYRYERVQLDEHCGEPAIGVWEVPEARSFAECIAVWASPELGQTATVCEPGDPTLRCWGVTMEGGCPYRRLLVRLEP